MHEQIDEAIGVHEKVLMILWADGMSSEWVKTEIAKARKREVRLRYWVVPLALSDDGAGRRTARASASAERTQVQPSLCWRPISSSGTPEWRSVTSVWSPRASIVTVTMDSAPLVASDIHVYSTTRGRSIWRKRP